MSEHEHRAHEHESDCEACGNGKRWFCCMPANIIAGSILLAAVLVAGAIVYQTKAGAKNSYGQNTLSALQQQAKTTTTAGANAATTQKTGQITVPDRKDQPTEGKSDAKVTIYEFSDFQCPYCKKFIDETYAKIKSQYIDTGKVKLVFRHFPLSFHVNAQIAAQAAECANQQGKFWEYHDVLFKNSQSDGTGLASADLKKYADQLGLNSGTLGMGKNKFNQCLDNNSTQSIVAADQQVGQAAGVTGTPAFVINGTLLVGAQPFSVFQQAIDAALSK